MIIPSGRAATLAAACALPALAVAVAIPAYWYAGLFPLAFLIALLIVDAIILVPAYQTEAILAVPNSANVGETVALHLTTDAEIEARVEHDERLLEGSHPLAFTAVRRGTSQISALWLRWTGPFGLARRIVRRTMTDRIAIVPDVRPARSATLQLFRRDMQTGETVQRDKGEGAEFDALAEFRPGMDRRAIDWKHSARHAKLLAKEYRIERNNDIVFAIDSGRAMSDPVDGLPRVDRAVSAALAAAVTALKLGDKVQLYSFDARPRLASGALSGPNNFTLFQRLAADIDYSTDETNFTLALTMLGARLVRRSLVMVFTDVADPASAERMISAAGRLAQKHLVLFVLIRDNDLAEMADAPPDKAADISRAVVAADLLRERRIIIARLQRLGIQIVEAPYDRLGPDLVNAYLGIKRKNML
jgi:uncharacterized protein (DUF58 family)